MSAQPEEQPFTKRDARDARRSYQHLAHVVDRLVTRDVRRLDEATAKAVAKPAVFSTIHKLHGFLNGREASHEKPVIKAHKFVVPFFDYLGDVNSPACSRFMDRRLGGLASLERALGHRYLHIRRADNETLLFTSYEGTPLLDAAEWVYLQARSNPNYWKNPAAAITDELLDAALAKLPEVKAEKVTQGVSVEDAEEGESGEEGERWASADLMAGKILKGRWTKWENKAFELLEAEFDAGGDPELVAAREATKIIKAGKDIKQKLARERLRTAMSRVNRDDEDDDDTHSGKDSVPPVGRGTLDKNVGGTQSEVVDFEGVSDLHLEDFPEIQRNALDYAAQGIAVLPLWGVADGICDCPAGSECRTAGKHPHSLLARNGVYSAATDPVIIRKWFEKDPRINLGVAMGGALNLICVDIDPRNDGDASYSDLIDAHGEDAFPETFTVKTGGGGWHRYYRLPYTINPKTGELKGKLGPGIDIKGVGGQIVAPGSVHASGRHYEVESNCFIAEAPQWVVNSLVKSASGEKPDKVANFQAHRDRKRAGVEGTTIVEGERNERLFKVGCALWGKGEVSGRAELFQRLIETNLERVSPPLDSSEVYKVAESIAGRYPLGVPIQEEVA
jgi:hypothetical protein